MVATTSEYILKATSTAPGNPGADIEIYVKRFEPHVPYWEAGPLPVVMVHGLSVPGTVAFDLDGCVDCGAIGGGHYSLARELAETAGLDVFIVELQGMGLSSRPEAMNNQANADPAGRYKLGVTTPADYDHHLFTTDSDLAELDEVVNKIMTDMPRIPPGTKVQLLGYSAGATVVGPYAIKNPDKVASVVLIAPIFNPDNPDVLQPLRLPPMTIQSKLEFTGKYVPGTPPGSTDPPRPDAGGWQYEVETAPADGSTCGPAASSTQYVRDDRIVERVWQALYESDRSGLLWPARKKGTNVLETAGWRTTSSYEESDADVIRYRNVTRYGWNTGKVRGSILGDKVPVLIVYGDRDKTAMHEPNQPPAPSLQANIHFNVEALYKAIPGVNKLLYRLECTGHSLLWEQQRHRVHELVSEWLHSVRTWPHSIRPRYNFPTADGSVKEHAINSVRGTTGGTFGVPSVGKPYDIKLSP